MSLLELPPRYDLAPMQRVETAWRPPWILIRAAQQGVRHFNAGEPIEDSHTIGGAGTVSWLVLADGVSSARFSHDGSRLACHAIEHYLGHQITKGAPPSKKLLLEAIGYAHGELNSLAKRQQQPVYEYACTLAAALINGDHIIAASIGDSSIATSSTHKGNDGKDVRYLTGFVTPKQSGASDETWSLIEPKWLDVLATNETRNPAVDGIYLATDGGQNFFTDEVGPDTYEFDPAYPNALRDALGAWGPLLIGNVMTFFMEKEPAENKDDRSILIAYRPPQNLAPPAQEP
ncbi:PP2C family serine/threonine-protein phosphatase [Hyphomicrobium sp. DY-1]|uniref:PP2C family serine/threonine-protein phosphatase n=1 Tax=Hyphomicrobium sp. DY-1 TaxID=3075650 RepID=UPI0039C3FB1E